MIKKILALIFLLPFFVLAGCSSKSVPTDLVGKKLPVLRLTYADGSYGSSESYRGKRQLYIFWAEWCATSRKELAKIRDFAARTRKRDDIALVAINVDDLKKEEKVRTLMQDYAAPGFVQSYSGNGVYDDAFTALDLNEVPVILTVIEDGTITSVTDEFHPEFFDR